MSTIWLTFSTNNYGTFNDLSINILNNLNNIYTLEENKIIDNTSNFIIYKLDNNLILNDGNEFSFNHWKKIDKNSTLLYPFNGYWLGGISLKSPPYTNVIVQLDFYELKFNSNDNKMYMDIGYEEGTIDFINQQLNINNIITGIVNYSLKFRFSNHVIDILNFIRTDTNQYFEEVQEVSPGNSVYTYEVTVNPTYNYYDFGESFVFSLKENSLKENYYF
jgi:hypothetical protein